MSHNPNGSPFLTRRGLFVAGAGVASASALGIGVAAATGMLDADATTSGGGALEGLQVMNTYPRAIFGRQTELARNWPGGFDALGGVMGKLFPEEIDDSGPHGDFSETRKKFVDFKRDHSDQIALLHFNAKARRPEFDGEKLDPRHWLYLAGARISKVTDAGDDTATFTVTHPDRFTTRDYGQKKLPDEMVVVPAKGGDLDWSKAEHVRLKSKDGDVLTVERGVRDEFPPVDGAIVEHAYIAAHARVSPPAMKDDKALWAYNYSRRVVGDDVAPLGDVLAKQLASYLRDGGELELLDGIEFDVQFFLPNGKGNHPPFEFCPGEELVDVDNDGKVDQGFVDGVNEYGAGVVAFAKKLRELLGEDKLMISDGMNPEVEQRNFEYYSGLESEGFPAHRDPDAYRWTDGINQHAFWNSRSRPKHRIGNTNHKYTGKPKGSKDLYYTIGTDNAYAHARLVMASTCFTDSMYTLSKSEFSPKPGSSDAPPIFDELRMGTKNRPGWLGNSRGKTMHLAREADDELDDQGVEWPSDFVAAFKGDGAGAKPTGSGESRRVEVTWDSGLPDRPRQAGTRAPLRDITIPLPKHAKVGDVFVELSASGDAVDGYADTIARLLRVQLLPPTKSETPIGAPSTFSHMWISADPFTAFFMFRDVPAAKLHLRLSVEGPAPLRLHRLRIHAAANPMARVFDNGIVIANPTNAEQTFDLPKLADAPKAAFTHLSGVPEYHDPNEKSNPNDGSKVSDPTAYKLKALDARFLRLTR